MAQKEVTATKTPPTLGDSLAGIAHRLDASKATRPGVIAIHASGEGGGSYRLKSGEGKSTVASFADGADGQPVIEIMGDAATIRAIIEGQKDGAKVFFAGGLRVRGDLRYFSDLALELGFIDNPL